MQVICNRRFDELCSILDCFADDDARTFESDAYRIEVACEFHKFVGRIFHVYCYEHDAPRFSPTGPYSSDENIGLKEAARLLTNLRAY